jgi:hypothetical protein
MYSLDSSQSRVNHMVSRRTAVYGRYGSQLFRLVRSPLRFVGWTTQWLPMSVLHRIQGDIQGRDAQESN